MDTKLNENIIMQSLNSEGTKLLRYDNSTDITTFMLKDNISMSLSYDEMKVTIDTWSNILKKKNEDEIDGINKEIQTIQVQITDFNNQIPTVQQQLDQAFTNKQLNEATDLTNKLDSLNYQKENATKTLNTYKDKLAKISNTTPTV